jgi:hypothetical protein
LTDRYSENLLAAAVFAAVAFLFVVHRAILAGLFAALFISRKTHRANDRREDRHQDLQRVSHVI